MFCNGVDDEARDGTDSAPANYSSLPWRRILPMRSIAVLAVAVVVWGASLTAATTPADAKGCIKGAIVGGVAGHYAGHHGVAGAVAGCVIGRHEAHRRDKQQQHDSNATEH